MASFPNVYTHRKVADTAARACEICFKSSSSVLVTPDKRDFFYVCPAHLKQSNFCKPIIDQAAVEAKKQKQMEEEVAKAKKEYEERQRKKKEKEEADKSKDKDKAKDEKKETDDKKTSDEKPDASSDAKGEATLKEEAEEEPRVFELHRTFYQGRLEKKRQAEIDKRNRERLMNPATFPSVPKGLP